MRAKPHYAAKVGEQPPPPPPLHLFSPAHSFYILYLYILVNADVRPPAIVRGLSPKVAVTDTQGLGRSVVATTGIAAGEVILVQEKPFCAALFAEHATRCCHNCFSNVTLTLSLPCTSCTQVIFCSATCRDEVSIWHTDICGKSLTGLSDELRLALFSLLKQAAQSGSFSFFVSNRTHSNSARCWC